MSMLLEAVHRVNVPRAAALLLRGADVNATDAQGVTPLIIACERGEMKMVDLLLEAKASTKMVTNDTQSSCLHIAAKNNAAEIVDRLLKVDPTIEERATSQGDTPLMVACLSAVQTEASAATLRALLQPKPRGSSAGGGINSSSAGPKKSSTGVPVLGPEDPRLVARNRHGHTALHCAAFAQSPTAVRMLLEAGADCTVVDKAGRTAVEVALNLNKNKTTALREGARGGSAPAAECLRLLKERWAELENEAKERQRVLLGELEEGEGDDRRGSSGGGGPSGATGGKKSTRRKKKLKLKQQQQQQQRGTNEGVDADAVQGGGREHTAEGAAAESSSAEMSPVMSTAAAGAGAGASASPSEASADGSALSSLSRRQVPVAVAVANTLDGDVQSGRRLDGSSAGSSDSEGETDDEAGSHPSSEAETGSHEGDPTEITAAAAAAAAAEAAEESTAVVAGLAKAEGAEATPVVGAGTGLGRALRQAGDEAASGSSFSSDVAAAPTVAAEAFDAGETEVDEAWSLVARPTRRKKATPSSSPPARLSRPRAPLEGTGMGAASAAGSSGRMRGPRPARREFGASSGSRSTKHPSLSARELVPPAAKGALVAVAARGSNASRSSAAPSSGSGVPLTGAGAVAAAGDNSAVTSVASAPQDVKVPEGTPIGALPDTPEVAAAAVAVASSTVLVAEGHMPAAVTTAKVESAAPSEGGREDVEPAAKDDKRLGAGGGSSSGSGSGSSSSSSKEQDVLVRRQLNVNADAWQPAAPTPLPPQEQHQHLHMQPQPQPQPQPQLHMHPSPPPMPFSGVSMPMGAAHGLCHPQQQQPPPPPASAPAPPPALWGNHQQVLYNNGFAPIPPPPLGGPPMHMHPGNNTVNGDPTSGLMMPPPPPPPPPPPLPQAALPRPPHEVNGGGFMMPPGAPATTFSPAIPEVSPPPGDARTSVAQEMLEASSPQALALALRVEHLVWSKDAMSAGLSMGQLDTLKTVLLDQVARVDEAKLEQVRVQERCRSEESTNIMNQLQNFQEADTTTTSAKASTSAETTTPACNGGDDDIVADATAAPALAGATVASAVAGSEEEAKKE